MKEYPKHIIEIADFIFKNPAKNREAILAHFGTQWHKPRRTLNRYISQAKQLNRERLEKQEKAKEAKVAKAIEKKINDDIATREEVLKSVTRILRGKARKIEIAGENEVFIPTDSDIMKAANSLVEWCGWKEKIEITDEQAAPEIKVNVLSENDILEIQKLSETV